MNSNLYDTQSENFIIGALLNEPNLVYEELYRLSISDFHNRRNQIIFGVISNLASKGVEHITPQDVDSYLMRYPEQYSVYNENNGLQALMVVYENGAADHKIFEIHLERIKKFSVLRDLSNAGIDTNQFYDTTSLFNSKVNEEFENLSINDIISRVKEQINDVEDKYVSNTDVSAQLASVGLDDLITRMLETPEIGEFLDGDIYNYVVRGARPGKYYINSAGSGHGKTRTMVGQACGLAFPMMDNEGRILVKERYHKVLYIATEQAHDEIQTLILSYISGVPEDRLLYGNATQDEINRLRVAAQIVELFKDNLILEYIPNPSISLVKTKIAKHIYKSQVGYVFYDYIFNSPGLVEEFHGARLREDVVLMMLSNSLKETAVSHGVFLQTATQISGDWEKAQPRNAGFIRGSKAIVDKADVGTITVKLTQEEIEKVQVLIEELCPYNPPNMVMDVYKNRRGAGTEIKIFRKFDHATCRTEDLFMTDAYYNPLNNYTKLRQKTKVVSKEELFNGN